MTLLTNEQLANIKKTTETGYATRKLLAIALSEAIGNGCKVYSGYVNGHGNSIELYYDDQMLDIHTRKLADRVAIECIIAGEIWYTFDKEGNIEHIKRIYTKQVSERSFKQETEIIL